MNREPCDSPTETCDAPVSEHTAIADAHATPYAPDAVRKCSKRDERAKTARRRLILATHHEHGWNHDTRRKGQDDRLDVYEASGKDA